MHAPFRHLHLTSLVLALSSMAACSGTSADGRHESGAPDSLETVESELTLMPKPGNVGANTEAGRDIEQLGAYTLYGADGDDPENDGAQRGSVHLFKNGAPLRSYRLNTGYAGTQFGNQVAVSPNWIVASASGYPIGNQTYETVLIVIGKDAAGEYHSCGPISAGQVPACVPCSGSACSSQSKVGAFVLDGFSSDERTGAIRLDIQGDEIVVGAGARVASYKRSGNTWVAFSGASLDAFSIRDLVIDGNRLAVGFTGPYHSSGVVDVFERESSATSWVRKLRVLPDDSTDFGFGNTVDLSGDRLLVASYADVHLFQLASGSLPAGEGLLERCVTNPNATSSPAVALSGDRVVVAAQNHTATYKHDGNTWAFQGGLPATLFPSDPGAQGGGGFWGVAIDGDRAAVGWRNYKGTPATGAALGFSFDANSCGQLIQSGAGAVRALPLTITNASGPSLPNYPPSNAIDTNVDSSWANTKTAGTTLTLTLSELQTLSLLQVHWGTGYARDYAVEVSEDGNTWRRLQRVTHGDGLTNGVPVGLTDWIDLRNNPQAFGKMIRIVATSFSSAGNVGVSIRNVRAYARVHDLCAAPPEVSCQPEEQEHVCKLNCGGSANGCYCDKQCISFGDCCSPDGSDFDETYYPALAAACNFSAD